LKAAKDKMRAWVNWVGWVGASEWMTHVSVSQRRYVSRA
jgi:hypothetical protein